MSGASVATIGVTRRASCIVRRAWPQAVSKLACAQPQNVHNGVRIPITSVLELGPKYRPSNDADESFKRKI